MSRGELDKPTLERIALKLPSLESIDGKILTLSPDFISMQFPHTSTIPIASVCLQDTLSMLYEARYALSEIYAHRVWYLEIGIEHNEQVAIFFSKFYADSIILRLYSSAEHLASAIMAMLEIDKKEISKVKKVNVNRLSVAKAVGQYLLSKKSSHPISKAVSELVSSPNWQRVDTYRGKWVHEQPPLIQGMGIVWKRRILWEDDGKDVRPGVKARILHIGGGDKPDLTVNEIIKFAHNGFSDFIKVLEVCVDYYFDLLKENGIKIERKK